MTLSTSVLFAFNHEYISFFLNKIIWCNKLLPRKTCVEHSARGPKMTIHLFPLLGKGEQGRPYPLTEEDHGDSAYRENGFNIFVSNSIALERSLPDIRHAKWVSASPRARWLSLPVCFIILNVYHSGIHNQNFCPHSFIKYFYIS